MWHGGEGRRGEEEEEGEREREREGFMALISILSVT